MTEEFRGYYPGSKKPLPIQRGKKKTTQKSEPWDAHPVKKLVKKQTVEFFTIGAVCAAFGRPAVTIRLWIRKGYIPKAPYKMQDKNGVIGRRLYRREHIEALIRVAQYHGILDIPRVDWVKYPTFADDVRREWKSLSLR